jgi:hypothetical protein
VDVGYAAQRRALVGSVRALERATAHSAGLAMVYTAQPCLLDHDYRQAGGGLLGLM